MRAFLGLSCLLILLLTGCGQAGETVQEAAGRLRGAVETVQEAAGNLNSLIRGRDGSQGGADGTQGGAYGQTGNAGAEGHEGLSEGAEGASGSGGQNSSEASGDGSEGSAGVSDGDGGNSSGDAASQRDEGVSDDLEYSIDRTPAPEETEKLKNADVEEMADGEDGFYYQQLTEDRKEVYRSLCTGIAARKSIFYVRAKTMEDIGPAFLAVLKDHPEFFWLNGRSSTYGISGIATKQVTVEFNMDASEIDGALERIRAEAQSILDEIPEGASAFEKAQSIYTSIIRRTEYDVTLSAPQNQNIQSVFLYHRSVCAGYARAFQYMCDLAGIPCMYVEGTIESTRVNGNHSWNLLELDGTWVQSDITWGDPSYTDTDSDMVPDIFYEYLGMTDEESERSGHFANTEFSYPECNSREYNAYILRGQYYETFSYEELERVLYEAIETDADGFHAQYANFDIYAEAMQAIFEGGLLNEVLQEKMRWDGWSSMTFIEMHSDELCTINVYWRGE